MIFILYLLLFRNIIRLKALLQNMKGRNDDISDGLLADRPTFTRGYAIDTLFLYPKTKLILFLNMERAIAILESMGCDAWLLPIPFTVTSVNAPFTRSLIGLSFGPIVPHEYIICVRRRRH